jgi:hypothetical protein
MVHGRMSGRDHPEPAVSDAELRDLAGDDFEDEFEEAVMNCHKYADGTCGAAGSEYCEFDCPFR